MPCRGCRPRSALAICPRSLSPRPVLEACPHMAGERGRPVLVFVSGAVRSGKSKWAESYALFLAGEKNNLVYIATARADDQEMLHRVALHKAARKNKGFETLERSTDVGGAAALLPPDATVLLECLGTLLANEMFDLPPSRRQALNPPPFSYVQKIFDEILSLRDRAAHLLVVSNDLFSDGIAYDESMENYRRALGALHVKLAGAAELAVECVAGLPIVHKL